MDLVSEELKKDFEQFKDKLPKVTDDFVTNIVFKESKYLFIEKKEDKVKDPLTRSTVKVKRYFAYCTHCKKQFEVTKEELEEVYKHKHQCECKKCKSTCRVQYARYRRSKMIDSAYFMTYQKGREKDTVLARGFYADRDYTGDYKKVKNDYREIVRFIFNPGTPRQFLKDWYYKEWYETANKCSWRNQWGYFEQYDFVLDQESVDRAVENTVYKYMPFRLRDKDCTNLFWKYSKYPILEKLYKAGFKEIAECIVDGSSLMRTVKWKQTDIFKFLGINKAEAKQIKEYARPFWPVHLKMYKFARDEKLKWTLARVYELARFLDIDELKKIKQYAGINKVINYLERQLELKGENGLHNLLTLGQALITWFDYIGDLKNININLKNANEEEIDIKKSLFPANLYKAHQDTISKIRYFKNKEFDEQIEKLIPKREKYRFEYKGLIIRAAESSAEIIREGETLHHCVGGYVKRHAKGETNILFIRKLEEIDKPYYTVEIRKGEVIQVHGLSNINATDEIKEFMKMYEKKVLKKFNKSKKIA